MESNYLFQARVKMCPLVGVVKITPFSLQLWGFLLLLLFLNLSSVGFTFQTPKVLHPKIQIQRITFRVLIPTAMWREQKDSFIQTSGLSILPLYQPLVIILCGVVIVLIFIILPQKYILWDIIILGGINYYRRWVRQHLPGAQKYSERDRSVSRWLWYLFNFYLCREIISWYINILILGFAFPPL